MTTPIPSVATVPTHRTSVKGSLYDHSCNMTGTEDMSPGMSMEEYVNSEARYDCRDSERYIYCSGYARFLTHTPLTIADTDDCDSILPECRPFDTVYVGSQLHESDNDDQLHMEQFVESGGDWGVDDSWNGF